MNERIKAFAKQADEGYTGNSEYDMGDALVGNDAIKKFAELIVRDCYSVIIKSQRGHFNPATSWDAVKQHFGVEE